MKAINLIPREQRSGGGSIVGRSGGAALIVLALIVGVAVLAAMYGSASRQISKQTGEVAKLEAQTAEVRASAGRLAPYTAFVAMAEQRTKTVAQLVQARFDWSHTLDELGRVLPSGSSLQSLSGTVGSGSTSPSSAGSTGTSVGAGSTPVSSTPPGSTPAFALTGCSISHAELAQTLQRLKLMDGVSEVHLQSAVKSSGSSSAGSGASGGCTGGGVTFSIAVTFAALPASPLPNVSPKTATAASVSSGPTTARAAQVKGATR